MAPTMEVSGIGNYSGKLIFNYAIEKKSISDNEISISANDVIYKNKAGIYKSKVIVKDVNGKTLSAGKATVIIRGKGGLGGEKAVKFVIKPKEVK